MKLKTLILMFLLSVIMSTQSVFAQQDQEPLITDRPDATESPNTVGSGFLQFETGAFYQELENNLGFKSTATTLNTMLVRFGIVNNLELRLGWNLTKTTLSDTSGEDEFSLNGFEPLLVGAKLGIAKENGLLPQIGLIGQLYLPFVASPDYESDTAAADLLFAFSHTLNESSSLSYNLGARWGDYPRNIAYVYSVSYGYAIIEKVGVYAELYGELVQSTAPNHLWDAGITYLINNNLQLDATFGSGIRSDQNFLLSVGVSYRINTKKSN